jgi:hypothetical protein
LGTSKLNLGILLNPSTAKQQRLDMRSLGEQDVAMNGPMGGLLPLIYIPYPVANIKYGDI